MTAAADIGPTLPSRAALRVIANEAHQLVLILLDTTAAGGDLARATRTFKKLQAVVGPPREEDSDGER